MGLVRHFERFFKAMKPALVDDQTTFVWASYLNHPLYNLITHLSCQKENLEEFFDSLVQKFFPHTPHACWVHSENQAQGLESLLLERGYKFLVDCPILTWQVKRSPQPLFDIRRVVEREAFDRIFTITSKYEPVLGEKVARMIGSTRSEDYLGYLDGHPVGIVTLFLDGDTGLVSNLATLDEYHRRGCGRALMLTLMNRAHERGLKQLVLGTSPAAEKLYDSLGFKKQMTLRMYAMTFP